VVVIGGGFTGLAAAYELARRGRAVTVLEKEVEVGGLAGSFQIEGNNLEKFYHHWFITDEYIIRLAKELGVEGQLLHCQSHTGMYLDHRFYKLSSPGDVLKFTPLGLRDRVRLGLLVLRARRVKDWKKLESITAQDWLMGLCGEKVFRTVWEPLLRGKFGSYASSVSAVWFWNKLVLRGGSRGRSGHEVLVYYRGGFAGLVEKIVGEITAAGGVIKTATAAEEILAADGRINGVRTAQGIIPAQAVIATPALPIIAELGKGCLPREYLEQLRKIEYLANICLVLELSQSLSEIYWLNVNDPSFPFVGIIEHTNFQPLASYGGRHIIYLSKYLPPTEKLYQMTGKEIFEFSLPHIKNLFPKFVSDWVLQYSVFKAPYAQPVVVCNYSRLIPPHETPIEGLYIASMAQIYPEDRGTNYAVREGRNAGRMVAQHCTEKDAGKIAREKILK